MTGRGRRAPAALVAIALAAAVPSHAAAWFKSVVHASPDGGGGIVEVFVAGSGGRLLAAGRDDALYSVELGRDGTLSLTRLPLPRPQRLPAYPDMLPDGEVATGSGTVREAFLIAPTRRYGHGVLGDAVEAGGIKFVLADGTAAVLALDERSVFEDRFVRLADIDGDGVDDAIAVRSYLDAGAALAVVSVKDGAARILAETPPIGRPMRWLNPVGAADLDGDGSVEIALVRTPHIGGVLEIHHYASGRMTKAAELGGFSNHKIGSRQLRLSAIVDADGDGRPDIVVPDRDRVRLSAMSFAGGGLTPLGDAVLPAPIAGDIVVFDLDRDGRPELCFPLENGEVAVVHR